MSSQGNQIKAPRRAFTLVELLVVIGIIAVLIVVLLPRLNKARQASATLKCMSNLRVLGQASLQYSIDNKNCFLPAVVFSSAGADFWPHLLINQKYLPVQKDSPALSSVFVCPAVQTDFVQANSVIDGIRRQTSTVLHPPSGSDPGLTIEFSYGINGTSYDKTSAVNAYYPCTSIAYDASFAAPPLKKRSMTKISSDLVFMFDGKEWNVWAEPTNGANIIKARICGWRHGGWLPSKPDSSGRVNVSFMDGHVATFPRSQLPSVASVQNTPNCYDNSDATLMNQQFPYPKWRLDQERGTAGPAAPPSGR